MFSGDICFRWASVLVRRKGLHHVGQPLAGHACGLGVRVVEKGSILSARCFTGGFAV